MYPAIHAAVEPDRPAYIDSDTGDALTYRQLDDRSLRLANHLRSHGLTRGNVVCILATNAPEYLVAYWACLRSGLYATGVNHHLSVDEAAYIVNDSGANALIVSADLDALSVGVLGLSPAIVIALAWGGIVEGFDDYESVLAQASAAVPTDQPRGSDMLYSSGTTGIPKGVRPPLPARQVGDEGDPFINAFKAMYGFAPDTVYLSPAPLYHAAPLRFCGFVTSLGGTLVVMKKFEPQAALDAIARFRCTHSQWVPTMFVRMLKLPERARAEANVSTMRVAIHAAAPCPPEVKQAMIDWWGPILYEYYGSTEGNGVTFVDSAQWLAHPGTVGKAGIGIAHICDEDGISVPAGETGTVYFERETLPFSYHNDPDKTAAATHPLHPTWTAVGDLGHLDEEGFLYLTGRKAFTIISGGVNIYPQEIENCLTMHPAVLDVGVVGLPDDDLGERAVAIVQVVAGVVGGDLLAGELLDHVAGRLARYKVPRSVVFRSSMPRTPTGKLIKSELLRELLEESR
jgi:long-chain acyl-CoA synthetase